MAEQRVQRRLAAIMVADVVGYSRLMERDEPGTLAALRQRRLTVVEPVVKSHHGRIVKLMGDGALMEFASAVNAFEAATELQKRMGEANHGIPDERAIVLRIGINVGDVVGEGRDIYGDGVNIAARLEAMAKPGGICMSAKVHDELRGKLDFAAEDLGEVTLKNITRPVRVYRSGLPATDAAPAREAPHDGKASIAVLPFDNMSADPGHAHFADGLAENIITNLSRFRDLAVIARNSSFAYRGKAATIPQISRELSASYILEGSVQRAGDRVRITAQLIEGASGRHLWAERYDREMEDIFKVQDEVTETIVGTLASGYVGRLAKAWQNQARQGGVARQFQAFDLLQRGLHAFDLFTRSDVARARELFQAAIDINPLYARAHAKLAWTHLIEVSFGWSESTEVSLAKGFEFASRAIDCDDQEAWGHWALGGYYLYVGRHDLAGEAFDKGLALNPNDPDLMTDVAYYLGYSGRTSEALAFAKRAMRLNPHYPEWYILQLGPIQFDARNYAEAIHLLEGMRTLDTIGMRLYLAASHAALGHHEAARQSIARILEMDPAATITRYTAPEMAPYKVARDLDHFRDNLRKAALPE